MLLPRGAEPLRVSAKQLGTMAPAGVKPRPPEQTRRHPAWSGRFSSRWIFSALSITGSLIRRWIGTACPRHSCDATG